VAGAGVKVLDVDEVELGRESYVDTLGSQLDRLGEGVIVERAMTADVRVTAPKEETVVTSVHGEE
jgi:hypothetical protein